MAIICVYLCVDLIVIGKFVGAHSAVHIVIYGVLKSTYNL